MGAYVPQQGDFVSLTFDPQSGHEQRGRRPALVVSKQPFNRATGMAIACPVTSVQRGFPFHVPIPAGAKVTGVVMVERVKSLDFRARAVRHIGRGSEELLAEVLSILDACIY